MSTRRPPRLPWRLLLLDLTGAVLVALGVFELLTRSAGLLPVAHGGWLLIGAGLAIMLPAVRGLLVFLAQARRR